MESNRTILVVAAHPDDEVLGCGGTIAKMAQEGAKAFCLFLGKGKAARGGAQSVAHEQAVLQKEAEEASRILGISGLFWEDFPDQKYDSVPFLEIVRAVEAVKKQVQPDTVFVHHPADINLDHQVACRAALTAFRPLPGEKTRALYAFAIPASLEWAAQDIPVPNVFVDIRETFAKKQQAVQAYQSELREYPHPRSVRFLEIHARYWGGVAGKEFAEPYQLVRQIQ